MDISVLDDKWWKCKFGYDPRLVRDIKHVGGAKFNPDDKSWKVPATLDSWERLHQYFDESELQFDRAIPASVKSLKRLRQRLSRLSEAQTAELTTLPELHPDLYEWVRTRGYQLADIAFMAECPHPLNTNEPGTGKTVETIASVFEAGLDEGPVLVVAPKTALDAVWLFEISKWLDGMGIPAGTVTGQGDSLTVLSQSSMQGLPCWVIANPEAIKQRSDKSCKYPWIYEVDWNVVVIDEFHRMGLTNNQTLMFQSMRKIKAEKRIALSGTPMGGVPIKLWGVLHFLYPEIFSSKWAFAENWLTMFDNGFGKQIGDVKKHLRDDFSSMIASYSVRRKKTDIMQWLPEKQYIDRYVHMGEKQAHQYNQWAADGEIDIEEEQLSAVSILALYTRLRQFAGAKQKINVIDADDGIYELTPTEDSCKLAALLDILEERGIPERGDSPVVIFSQFTRMINMVEKWLAKQKIPTAKITGAVKANDRTKAINDFQAGKVDVMLMNTNAGGVAITLDRSDTVVFLDETWNPDDQTQAEDRVHRGTKTSQVTVYKLITSGTIEEDIKKGNLTKQSINDRVLDRRNDNS